MHECFAHLLEQQWTVCNIKTDWVFDLLEAVIQSFHLLPLLDLELFSLLCQRLRIVLQGRTECNTLLQSSLDNPALELFILLTLFFGKTNLHLSAVWLYDGVVLRRGAWLLCDLITLSWVATLNFGEGWVNNLVLLVHVSAEVGTWTGLAEPEGLDDGWSFGLLGVFHFSNEFLLKTSEVRDRPRPRRSEIEELLACLGSLVFFLSGFLCSLHAWWQLGHLETLLGHPLDSLLTFVLVPFDHHFEPGNQDSPGHVPRSELIQDSVVDIVTKLKFITSFLLIFIVEAKWLWQSLVFGQTCLLTLLPKSLTLVFEFLVQIQIFAVTPGQGSRCGTNAEMVVLFSKLLFFFNLDPLLKRLLLARMLLEWKQDWNSQVVFTFASLGHFVLLICCFMSQLLLKFRFGVFVLFDHSSEKHLYQSCLLFGWNGGWGASSRIIIVEDHLFPLSNHTTAAEKA